MVMQMNDGEKAKRTRAAFSARASSDFYTGLGWVVGFLFMLFVFAPIIYFIHVLTTTQPRIDSLQPLINWLSGRLRDSTENPVMLSIIVAWWIPISLAAIGYIFANRRIWRSRVLLALFIWSVINFLFFAAIVSTTARITIYNGSILLGYVLVGSLILYIQFRVIVWLGAGRPGRFFFGSLGWAALHGLIYWAVISPEVLNIVLVVLGFVFRILFAVAFAIIQFVGIFWFMARSRVEVIRPGDPKMLTFEDYKGQPNLLKMVRQWISILSDRTLFQKMGGQFINGLLLYGEPGTGKTMLAKCMAGEAGIAFISIEGSGFRAMFWGVDVLKMIAFVSRARRLAREYGACIAYIDEIDAVGMSRGGVMGGQSGGSGAMGLGGLMNGTGALTRLLYEMDGISEQTRWEKFQARWYQLLRRPVPRRDWHVMFMGSTNRPDVLDPALTRAGRFDKTIVVNKPDRKGRREIAQYYLDKIETDTTVNVDLIVKDTAWATPAKIMSAITKDAVRLALFDNRHTVSQRDIDYAFQEQALGLENPIEEMEEDQRKQVAYHEAGHAVVQYYLRPDQRIVRVSIIRRSEALGYVMQVSDYDVYAEPLRIFVADIVVSMAGHVVTKLFLKEYWTGATGDFETARTQLWRLAHYGFFGPPLDFAFPSDKAQGGPMFKYKTEAVGRVWKNLEEQTELILTKHKPEIEALAQVLLLKNDLDGDQCKDIICESASTALPPRDIYSKQLIETIMQSINEIHKSDSNSE